MYVPRIRTILLALIASAGLAGCAYDDGYGYGGVSVGYGAGYYDPWYYDDYYPRRYGWYDGFYYPGTGYYVFDRKGHRHRWSDGHRRYWEGRRHAWRDNDRGPRDGRRGPRRDLQAQDFADPGSLVGRPGWQGQDRRGFRGGRSDARRDLRADDLANPGRSANRQRSDAARPQQRMERGEGRGVSARARSGERSSTGRGGSPRQRD
ncbi:hypothetical protein [Sphingomonas cavernae]|uniref:Peptidase n=1 Tax=Sphingomonas cavernae TaxID=2320861 RepID=A0A418W623_9SPHN|nr:hypothetical protein [Sphingomonas cavernae]RJF85424.1 hypothetical protein D3876_15905 [Sphingomonas cavernae]